jgi:tetratricopeptide (TPR) repeat protein
VTPLVGRDRELAAVAARLDTAAAGRGGAVLVSGEPGIGKTRFLEQAVTLATERGFATAWGRAWEVGSAPPYWPWIEALRELAARPALRDLGDELARAVPELGRGARRGAADAFAFYDAIAGFLDAAAARAPIAIVLDDLHAADPSSLGLAAQLAPQLARMRVVLFGSHRDVEARRDPAIEGLLVKIGRAGDVHALPRLDLAGVQALAGVGGEAARMIFEASDGNPLFVQELMKLLAARGAAPDVPAGVRAVIRERVQLLSPATVALLQAAAIVGRTFGVTLAAELAGVTTAALEDAIGEAAGADVVARVEADRYRFSHALVAETLAADLALGVRARLHRRAAEILERAHDGDPAAPLAEIADHWLAAGAEHAATAVDAAVRAAEGAARRVAFADAAELYERAIAALAIAAPNDARRRAELLVAQGDAWVRAGDRTRAQAPCVAASELGRALGDGALVARAALALGADVAVAQVVRVLVRLLEEALPLLPDGDDPWRARVMARLASARQPALDPQEPVALAEDALAMAHRLGDPDTLYEVMFAAGGAFADYARPEVRASLSEETARLAAARGDRARQLRSLQRLAFDCIDLADLEGFERAVAAYAGLADELRQPRYQWVPLLFRAMRAQWEGRAADDVRLADEALAIRERLGDPVAPMMHRVRRMMIDGPRTAEEIEEAVVLLASEGDAQSRGMRAWMWTRQGRLDDAHAELAPVLERAIRSSYHYLAGLSLLTWRRRDRALAAQLFARLLEDPGRVIVVSSIGFSLVGHTDHELARTAAVLGRWDDADRYAASALAAYARLGARPLAARIRADWAAMWLDRGDVARARELHAAARATADELDNAELRLACDEVEARFGGAAPAPAAPSDRTIRIAHEGEFWTVTGLGELCRIKDSRGMQMLAMLVASPGQDLHSLDLSGADTVDGGDAGEVIDREARASYQDRLRELRAELEEAEAWNDAGRRERAAAEIEALTQALSGAFGLGGRERRTGGAAERARQNVRRRIADALRRIEEACPALGRELTRAIKTGTVCRYDQ